ncbi:hypothetical protein ACIQOV_36010, partial [Kitasatospora sp. NPDC091257]
VILGYTCANDVTARDVQQREGQCVYVDWESPLIVRQVLRLARRTAAPLEFSEMLPAPEHLWLDIDGERHTSELRCAVFSRRSH